MVAVDRSSVAITGAAGQLGSRLRTGLSSDYKVTGFDLLSRDHCLRLDVTTHEAVSTLQGFDIIIHLAALISVDLSLESPLITSHTNTCGTLNVLEAARRGDSTLVVASSAAVYGQPMTIPIKESHPCNPVNPYGVSKLAGEMYCSLYRKLYGLRITIVRPFNVYSEAIRTQDSYAGVITKFIAAAKQGRPVQIRGDGNQTRDFVHVSDFVQLIGLLLRGHSPIDTVNCGSGRAVSVNRVAEVVSERFGRQLPVTYCDAGPSDVRESCADISVAQSIGYEPKVFLEEWIRTARFIFGQHT